MRKGFSFKNSAKITQYSYGEKLNCDFYFTPSTEVYSNWITVLIVKTKIIKLLGENIIMMWRWANVSLKNTQKAKP